jgi:hypothetical protein
MTHRAIDLSLFGYGLAVNSWALANDMRFAEWDAYCKDALVGGVSIESMRETPK